MIRQHAEQRSLVSWLIMQEKVTRLWIEEVLAVSPPNDEFLVRLEEHRAWLAEQIDDLTARRAA